MITENVYSPILDEKIHENIDNSPIWKNCFHESEIGNIKEPLYCYSIKFDGLKPIQVTKIRKPKIFKTDDKKRKRNSGRN